MQAPRPERITTWPRRDAAQLEQLCLRLLPEVNQLLILNNSDVALILPEISRRLQTAIRHSWAGIAVREDADSCLRLFGQHSDEGPEPLPAGTCFSLEGTPAGEAYRMRKPVLVQQLDTTEFPSDTTAHMLDAGLHSSCWVPLLHGAGVLGTFSVGSRETDAFGAVETAVLGHMANQLALAVANALMAREVEQLKKRVEREPSACQLRQRCAPDINLLAQALWDMSGRLLNANDAYLELVGSTRDELLGGQLSWYALTPDRYAHRDRRALEEIKNSGRCAPFEKEICRRDGLCIPVLVHAAAVDDSGSCIVSYMVDLRGRSLTDSPPSVGAAPRKQSPSIIVADRKTQELRQHVEKVAPTNATVLIQGETGTGKEVFAQLVHQLSLRRDQPFIKVNCAAIPSGLLESELFGHEKGAFTGATGRKIGRIELAHGGTLFLDEIGDLPLELQPKLLRVLQEQQFERLGGTKIRKVDIRLIAATNQDLTSMVGQGRFRPDLFYRLNVVRLTVPPLRERKESIPRLVEHFIGKSSVKFGRNVTRARPDAMLRLQRWHWPGNVRELENLIERNMIMTSGDELDINPADLVSDAVATPAPTTLRDVEREHILRIFRECGGVIAGSRGAAARLAVKRTTLQYKMKKLGISRQNL